MQVYGGKTLFEQFDTDIQRQIELLCVEIKCILQEGVDLLERRYGIPKEHDTSKESPTTSLLNVSTLTLFYLDAFAQSVNFVWLIGQPIVGSD
jgi:hypothetical protein